MSINALLAMLNPPFAPIRRPRPSRRRDGEGVSTLPPAFSIFAFAEAETLSTWNVSAFVTLPSPRILMRASAFLTRRFCRRDAPSTSLAGRVLGLDLFEKLTICQCFLNEVFVKPRWGRRL
jgi:hypothetical protein